MTPHFTSTIATIASKLEYVLCFYYISLLLSYALIGFVSARAVFRYRRERDLTDFNELLGSPLLPSLSIVAPAYNESVVIVENIRSLLSLHYTNLKVIIVNDGSKDDTLQQIIEAYELVLIPDYPYQATIPTKPVRGVYHSTNIAFSNLWLVDKENGGCKADASNAGINLADTDYFACVDVDCIIEADAFLKTAKIIMQAPAQKPVVGVGAGVWLTNDSIIEGGKMASIRTPDSFIGRVQLLEYFRAFLFGRTAWAKIDGLLLISGAFGVFKRSVVLEVGGYDAHAAGEDMELVMKMHMALRKQGKSYQMAYIPEPLCWTEVPSDYKVLSQQRQRWARGAIECLLLYKNMFLNPKYGVLGMVSYPYFLLAEWFAPFSELLGLGLFVFFYVSGTINWYFLGAMLVFTYILVVALSVLSIFVQEISYSHYKHKKDIWKLFLTALIEPILYHPRTVYWSLKGNFDYWIGKKLIWGNMQRAGFAKK